MALTKYDIVEIIVERIGFTKNQSADLLEQLLELIKKSLEGGEDVLVSGFGKFQVSDKSERIGRNPATGNAMTLRARRVITFKASNGLREKINEQIKAK
jgi:integration host factor subunit alpha